MSESSEGQILLRARYEHYTSTPDKRKLYVTLGFAAIDEDVFVLYARDSKRDVVYARQIDNFLADTHTENGQVKRFTFVDDDAISAEERNEILDRDEEHETRN